MRDYDRARRALMRQRSARSARSSSASGTCRLQAYQDGDLFSALVETIVSQQLSTRVADVIFARVCALCAPDPLRRRTPCWRSPSNSCAAPGCRLRRRATCTGWPRRSPRGRSRSQALEHLPDDEVIAALSSIKGIGRWSAQMILIFRLNRPDVWPIGDLGIVRALERLHRLPQDAVARAPREDGRALAPLPIRRRLVSLAQPHRVTLARQRSRSTTDTREAESKPPWHLGGSRRSFASDLHSPPSGGVSMARRVLGLFSLAALLGLVWIVPPAAQQPSPRPFNGVTTGVGDLHRLSKAEDPLDQPRELHRREGQGRHGDRGHGRQRRARSRPGLEDLALGPDQAETDRSRSPRSQGRARFSRSG